MTDWEGIVRGNGPTVWRTLFRLLGRRADVDECFQETFLSALEISRKQNVVCWSALLQTVATRKAVDRLRRKYRNREEFAISEAAASGLSDPARAVEEAERAGLLAKAMTRLPARQAEAICLHALSGWSYQEIGKQLGMSSSAVGTMIHRGKQRLRELLEVSLGAKSGGES
jgi:RNA polymerase sigma-70 factor (ECF subfamily)